jgi:carboxyl-terminal processing protease
VRRRRRLSPLVLVVVVPVVLVVGIWLGGHPQALPSGVRDTLVADSQGRLYEEAMDIIERDYYRPVKGSDLLNKSLGAAVKSLDDRFSNYFSPQDYASFSEVTGGAISACVFYPSQGPLVMA